MSFLQNLSTSFINVIAADAVTSSQPVILTILQTIGNILLEMIFFVYEFAVRVLYLISQFVMVAIDFVFVFIRQITGINTDFSNIDNIEESDILFTFLLSEPVVDVLKSVIIIAIVLIILLSIISIIKSEYLAATTGSNNNKAQILASSLRSLFLVLLVPILVIGSVFLSNAVLASLYNATSGGKDVSMSTQVFISSSYQANLYRRYADDNHRIPITYKFSEVKHDENISSWATDGTIAEIEEAYTAYANSSVWERGLTTYTMFVNNSFLTFDDVEKADKLAFIAGDTDGSAYHLTYDEGIFSKRVEYYQMAEVLDYAMKSHQTLYFKTPQQIYESQTGVSVDEKYLVFDSISGGVRFSVNYTEEGSVDYFAKNSVDGVYNESKGAVFIVSQRKTAQLSNGITKDYFVPLLAGWDFASEYTDGINPVVARGLFDKGKYPTAIKSEGGSVRFYRDEIYTPYIADFLPKISYELPEGKSEALGMKIIKEGIKLVTGLNPNDYIPYVYFNFNIKNLFSKTFSEVTRIEDGSFFVDYNFSHVNIDFENFYSYRHFNILIMVFCTTLILGTLFKAVFGVTARIFDIVLLWITYPAVCATIPLDNGDRMKKWTESFIGALFSVYGVVIGFNLVLLMFPIVDRIQIFSAADFENIQALGFLPHDWSAHFINEIFRIFMIFALFTLFKTIISVISSILGTKTNVIERGDDAIKEATGVVKKASDIVTGKVLVDTFNNAKSTALGFVPGSAMIQEAVDRNKFMKSQKSLRESAKDLSKTMRDKDNVTEDKLKDKTKDLDKMVTEHKNNNKKK